MAQTRVIIRDHTGSKKTLVELPDDVPLRRLLPALITRMNLPTSQAGQPISYVLDFPRGGRRLREDDTLASAGIGVEEILTLLPHITAGSSLSPRLRRLSSDYLRLRQLIAQKDVVELIHTTGAPPERYELKLKCRGIERIEEREPVYRDEHLIEIELPAGYPRTRPNVYFRTLLFHPNVQYQTQGGVCLGVWYASMWLDELVVMLTDMVQYYIPPTTISFDALNPAAVRWLRENISRVPLILEKAHDYKKQGTGVAEPMPEGNIEKMNFSAESIRILN